MSLNLAARVLFPAVLALLVSCAPGQPPELPGNAPAERTRVEATTESGIAYSDEGDASLSVLFVHGWSCEKEYWSAQVDALRDDYRVVTVDLGGHGASQGIERVEWTVSSLADDVVDVVETLELEEVVLVGHSMGGPVSLLAAARLPERVRAVIGVDTLQDVDYEWPEERFLAFIGALESDFVSTCGGMVRQMFPETTATEIVDPVVEMMCDEERAGIAVALMRDYWRVDTKRALEEAGVPIRAINAPTYATNLEANRRHARDFDAIIMEGVGHFPFLEQSDAFNEQLVKVLAELD